MKAEKIRNLTEDELKHQERDLADQLFKLKFQMNMGQTESLKKVRGLRRDIARVQTIRREQEIAGHNTQTKAQTKTANQAGTERKKHHKELIGIVLSNKMQKTIVVEVTRKKAHAMYGRVISIRKKFYAHDEKNETHPGDVVKIEESRPLSKLKRWTLKEIVQKTALVPEVADVEVAGVPAAK
jgi:small subunit ribosomal protein S17